MPTTRKRVVRVFLVLLAVGLLVLSGNSVALAAADTIIAWNPSHQNDTGSNGWHEYEACGDIATRAMALLPGFAGVLCWETGMGLTTHNYPALKSEVDQATAAHAQIFISIHVNGAGSSGFTGCYYKGDSTSARYAETLLKSVAVTMGLEYGAVVARTDLYVLDPSNNPAPIRVILECGDNQADRAWLSTEDGRQKLAQALAKAVSENTPFSARYEQADTNFCYTGTWTVGSTASASGSSLRYATAAGSSVTLKFTGTQAAWIAKTSPSSGKASLTLDGGSPEELDLYSSGTLWKQKVWDSGPLTYGAHTIRIDRTGKKSDASSGIDINVDAFDIAGAVTQAKPSTPTTPSVKRYEQTDRGITYLGKWLTFSATASSGGSYGYADSPAAADIWFKGTRLDLIATKGVTQGKALVSLDGADPVEVDLYAPAVLRQRPVWSTETLSAGPHNVKVTWTGRASEVGAGTRINIDAVDVTGTLLSAPTVVTYQQASTQLVYRGSWTVVSATSSSGGSFRYATTTGSSVTVKFTGTYLAWIAKKSPPYGLAKVTLDGGPPVTVDLYSSSTLWKQRVWDTGTLDNGSHVVTIEWTGQTSVTGGGHDVNVDAFEVLGSLG